MAEKILTLRESTIPQAFKFKVEENCPTWTNNATGETYNVQIALNPDPVYHSNSSVDIFGSLMMACANAIMTQKARIISIISHSTHLTVIESRMLLTTWHSKMSRDRLASVSS